MKNKKSGSEAGRTRRAVLKAASSGVVASTMLANAPSEWISPVVNSVVLPAHASTTTVLPVCPVCDVTLSIESTSIPSACSGSVFPTITLLVVVSEGCSNIEILDIVDALPAQASVHSSLGVGDIAAAGDVFSLYIDNYPSSSPLVCAAVEAGTLTIEYNCIEFDGPSSSFSIDVLAEILTG